MAPNGSDRPAGKSASDIIAEFLDAVYRTYFEAMDEPLPALRRGLVVFLGAATFAGASFAVVGGAAELSYVFERAFGPGYTPSIGVYVSVTAVIAAFFAWLVVTANTRHGPVRLYVSGISLPALTVAAIRAVWA